MGFHETVFFQVKLVFEDYFPSQAWCWKIPPANYSVCVNNHLPFVKGIDSRFLGLPLESASRCWVWGQERELITLLHPAHQEDGVSNTTRPARAGKGGPRPADVYCASQMLANWPVIPSLRNTLFSKNSEQKKEKNRDRSAISSKVLFLFFMVLK